MAVVSNGVSVHAPARTAFILLESSRSKHLQVNGAAELLTSVDGVGAKLLLDTKDLVELGKTLRAAGSTGLDLARAETDSNVRDGDVLSLTGAVRDHDTPAISVGVLGGLDRLGEGTNLVDLEEEGVARLEINGLLDTEGVGDSQVVTRSTLVSTIWFRENRVSIPNNLEVRGLVEVAPGLPVVLSEGVLDADNGILASKRLVEVGKLLVGEPLGGVAVGVLEVQVVLLGVGLVELAGGNIKGNLDLAGVAGLLNGFGDQVESLLGSLNVGGHTTLVTNVTSGLAVLLLGERLEFVVDLSTLAEGLGERGSSTCVQSAARNFLESQHLLRGATYEGTIMNSWKARRPPAWEPPFRTFWKGTGRT